MVWALVATGSSDQHAAQRAWEVLRKDEAPRPPWHDQDDDPQRWSEQRLEMDLLVGKHWPFFRDKGFDRARSNGHDRSAEQEMQP